MSARKVADLSGVCDHHGKPGRSQGYDYRDLEAAGCLENDEPAGSTTEVRDQGADPLVIIRHAPGLACGVDGDVELVLGDIDADPQRRITKIGIFSWRQHQIFVTEALRNETIGLEPIADGLWSVFLGDVLLGRFSEQDYRFTVGSGR